MNELSSFTISQAAHFICLLAGIALYDLLKSLAKKGYHLILTHRLVKSPALADQLSDRIGSKASEFGLFSIRHDGERLVTKSKVFGKQSVALATDAHIDGELLISWDRKKRCVAKVRVNTRDYTPEYLADLIETLVEQCWPILEKGNLNQKTWDV